MKWKRHNTTSGITLSGRNGEKDEDRNGWKKGWQKHAPWPMWGRGRRPGLPSITTLTLISFLLLSLSHTLSAPFNHQSQALVLPWSLSSPLLSSYKSISSPSIPPPSFLSPPPLAQLSLSLFLLTHLPPFIVGSAVGVERSGVGRREWENEAEAMNESKNERMSVLNQSVEEQLIWRGAANISGAFPTAIISAEWECCWGCVDISAVVLLP